MKTPRTTLPRRILAVFMVTILLFIPASAASANVRETSGGVTPYFAQIGFGFFFHTDDLIEISFYYDPECIPADFNLLLLFADTSACVPTTEGFRVWENGPGVDLAPKLSELRGSGAVPVWFVSWPAFQAAITDGEIYIGDLESMSPLKGTASYYHEVLRPMPTVKNSTMELNAKGTLEDGRTFTIHVAEADLHGLLKTRISFN